MTDKDIERRLADALAKSAPDDVEDVMSRCRSSGSSDSKGTVIPLNMAEKNKDVKKKNIWKGMAAACLAVMIVGGGSLYGYQSHAVASVVSLDVNPSIELKVNSREKVLSCEALNEEGKDVLYDMDNGKDLKGTKVDVAVNAIVGGLVKNGYFDSISSAILISVEDNDTNRADRLQKQLYNTVNSVLNDSAHTADVLSQTLSQDSALEAQAKSNNISTGKAALIEQIMKLNSSLKFEALSALSVEELKDLRDAGAPGMPIGRSAAASAASGNIGESKARSIALSHAGVSSSAVHSFESELDHENGRLVYEIEFKSGNMEYNYEIDAATGAIVKYESEYDD